MASNIFKHYKKDLPASLIVFLVAVPLCLGIAVASGAPALSGIIAGIIGGIVVGSLSNSPLGVSGPAAGLISIVIGAIAEFGGGIKGFEILLVAVIFAGILQIAAGYLKGGIIGYYFPNSLIKGMLAGIGVTIFMKNIPHALGIDTDPIGDDAFQQIDGETTTSEILNIAEHIEKIAPGAVVIVLISLAILILWEKPFIKKFKVFQLVQGPLIVVILGIILNNIFLNSFPTLALVGDHHLVDLPIANSFIEFKSFFAVPNFSEGLTNYKVYLTGGVIAFIASIETLLCLEATDKLDPDKRISDPNLELKAQGVGNMLSGFLGGLPITQVIVRSSANIQSGGHSKLSAILHGVLILLSLVLFPQILNQVPISTLAAILLVVGYKLANPSKFVEMFKRGWRQFVPFISTVILIYFTDMVVGMMCGLGIAVFIILLNNFRTPYFFDSSKHIDGEPIVLKLSENVTFLNKASMLKTLQSIPEGAEVIIDGTNNVRIDDDVLEIIRDFEGACDKRNICVVVKGLDVIQEEDGDKAYLDAVTRNKIKPSNKLRNESK